MSDAVLDELLRARVKLMIDQPLIGQMILHLELKDASTWCPTAATDGKHFFYNRDFIKSLDRPRLLFLTAHEVYHCILDHIFRRGDRDKGLWNMAIDFLVNDSLVKANIGTMPEGGLYDPDYSSDIYTAEELYTLLEKKCVTVKAPLDMHLEGNGGDSQGEQGEGPPTLTDDEIADIRDSIRATFLQAADQVGKVPAGLERLLNSLRAAKIDWRHMLDTVLRSTIKHDYTYTRLSRRSWSSGLVLPGQDVMDKVVAVAFLDGSASTTQEMVTDFLSECKGILSTFRDFELTLGTFDTEVYNVVVYTPENADDIDHYDFHGGGGTAPSCCWDYMEAHDIVPHKLMIFTDGWVENDWGREHWCDTLFIVHSNHIIAPYGVTLIYEAR